MFLTTTGTGAGLVTISVLGSVGDGDGGKLSMVSPMGSNGEGAGGEPVTVDLKSSS